MTLFGLFKKPITSVRFGSRHLIPKEIEINTVAGQNNQIQILGFEMETLILTFIKKLKQKMHGKTNLCGHRQRKGY